MDMEKRNKVEDTLLLLYRYGAYMLLIRQKRLFYDDMRSDLYTQFVWVARVTVHAVRHGTYVKDQKRGQLNPSAPQAAYK